MARKLALIIGNSTYEDKNLAKLVSPAIDVDSLVKVLRAPERGGFDEVMSFVDANGVEVRKAISRFMKARQREDLILLYFSGHGVMDEQGKLHLAVRDTEHDLLAATAIPADFITSEMNGSRSRRQLLILDCCHSGAVGRGTKGTPGVTVHTHDAFEGTGYGRVVLTATDATQYAWEGDQITGQPHGSVFTHHLIHGLQTGEADREPDGVITVEELYEYVEVRVREQNPNQTPVMFVYDQRGGKLVVANNPSARPKAEPPAASRPQLELMTPWDKDLIDTHYEFISEALISRKVMIFLGPETNSCGRPAGARWENGALDCVPSRGELAAYLAAQFNYPVGGTQELPQISQYVSDTIGRRGLDKQLHTILDVNYSPSSLHWFLAKLAALRYERNRSSVASSTTPCLLIISTNYDDALERTFEEMKQTFHLLRFNYPESAQIMHRLPGGECRLVEVPARYDVFFDDGLSVIVKLAGGVNRTSSDLDDYVITEEDQNKYLGRSMDRVFPVGLVHQILGMHPLFLGCGQGHWNRAANVDLVPLGRRRKSWTIQFEPYALDETYWMKKNIDFVPVRLEDYIRTLSERMLPRAGNSGRPFERADGQ